MSLRSAYVQRFEALLLHPSRVACSMRSTTMRMGWPSLGLIYDWEAAQERRRHSALPRHCPWIPRVHRRRRCSVATKQKRLIGAHLVRTAPSKRGSSRFFEPKKGPKSCQAIVIKRFSLVGLLGVTVYIYIYIYIFFAFKKSNPKCLRLQTYIPTRC